MSGNVFAISFSQEGIEAVVNLTEIDEQAVLAKMSDADEDSAKNVNCILSMMVMRARFNQHRNLEVWLVKLSDDFTEQELTELGYSEPQALADIARQGENLFGKKVKNKNVIE